ncbi:hypothetical protein CHY_2380 [Carboxydothermus hydrogenoformans Z-2901]|uniref:Uncharacterized protein n=1 Tax=Carboxydothermus hydrogenoformans (strain ATCC BAA-161 / DSM 6008 / Z-2901) TaxID=246194 RepID=Q3A9K7_CARHZ|nr:hypothetical protein CHY_2380 [Carboxydothermus hydrogenoformans Z-2901]
MKKLFYLPVGKFIVKISWSCYYNLEDTVMGPTESIYFLKNQYDRLDPEDRDGS